MLSQDLLLTFVHISSYSKVNLITGKCIHYFQLSNICTCWILKPLLWNCILAYLSQILGF